VKTKGGYSDHVVVDQECAFARILTSFSRSFVPNCWKQCSL
jgi:hypothetical protein